MEGNIDGITSGIMKKFIHKIPEDTPYISLDNEKKERMWKNAFVISTETNYKLIDIFDKKTETWSRQRGLVRWGMKVLSKEKENGKLYACFYFGDVDSNNDWHNKHGFGNTTGQFIDDMPKEEFEKFLVMMEEMNNVIIKGIFDVQDYSFLETVDAQMEYMMKLGQGEARGIDMKTKKIIDAGDVLKKIREGKNGRGRGKGKDNG
ncbi:MAG: hypothetical protein WC208_10395 [Gallionella sp.]|jgi:hypothetical protein